MTALIIPFHEYNSFNPELGRLLVKFVERNISKYNADVIYFVGRRMGFDNSIKTINNRQVHYVDKECGLFQHNVLTIIKKLSSGDKFILMDSDFMIYDYSLIDDIWLDLDEYDIVNCLDNGTKIKPTYGSLIDLTPDYVFNDYTDLPYKLEIMKPTEYRAGYSRFAHWIFGCSYDFFMKHADNFDSQELEPMEIFTRNIATLTPNAKIKELLEIRSSLFALVEGRICSAPNSNDSRCTEEAMRESKYYHIRNFGSLAYQIGFLNGASAYGTSPFVECNFQETIRIVAWNLIILDILGLKDKYITDINRVMDNCRIPNINSDYFIKYFAQFKEYHRVSLL